MKKLKIHKFLFPLTPAKVRGEFTYSTQSEELWENLAQDCPCLVLCALQTKADLIQLVNFFQKKKLQPLPKPATLVLVDFQKDSKLLAAAQRLSFAKIISASRYLADEERSIAELLLFHQEQSGTKSSTHQTYEDLFSGQDKLVLRDKSKLRLSPVLAEVIAAPRPINEVLTETPQVSIRLYANEKVIESRFNDYFEGEIHLTWPAIPEDNHLTLEFRFSYQGINKGLRLKGEVINIEEDDDEYQVVLKIESHLTEFEGMLELYQEREKNINTFIKKVKGY